MVHSIGRRARRFVGGAVTVALAVVVAGLAAVLVAHLFGYRPHVIRSGSMGDAVPTGSLVLTRGAAASDIEVDDIVVVDPPGAGEPRMHRVIERRDKGYAVLVRTKGDANRTADAGVFALTDGVPVPRVVIPGVGHVLLAAGSRAGLVAAVTVVASIIGLSILWSLWRPEEPVAEPAGA